MPDESRHKINVWVPESLWEELVNLGYTSPTSAVMAGFKALTEGSDEVPRDFPDREVLVKELEEARKTVFALTQDKEDLRKDKEDLMLMHNNYMAQMQSVLNSRLLEPPKKSIWRRLFNKDSN